MLGRSEVIIVEGRDDEEDEVHQEADCLHLFAAVQFVIDEEGWDGGVSSASARIVWVYLQAR